MAELNPKERTKKLWELVSGGTPETRAANVDRRVRSLQSKQEETMLSSARKQRILAAEESAQRIKATEARNVSEARRREREARVSAKGATRERTLEQARGVRERLTIGGKPRAYGDIGLHTARKTGAVLSKVGTGVYRVGQEVARSSVEAFDALLPPAPPQGRMPSRTAPRATYKPRPVPMQYSPEYGYAPKRKIEYEDELDFLGGTWDIMPDFNLDTDL